MLFNDFSESTGLTVSMLGIFHHFYRLLNYFFFKLTLMKPFSENIITVSDNLDQHRNFVTSDLDHNRLQTI